MMTARVACLAIALVLSMGGPASAQQPPQKGPAPPGAAKHAVPAINKAPPQPTIAVPQPEVLLVLIRSALIGLDHANRTGNYTVLRELGGPGLQQNSSAQLSNAFSSLRAQNVDLLPVAIVTPQITKTPSVSAEGLLQLVGVFPMQPRPIEFHIVYQPVNGQWKLFGLTVRLVAPQASAPEAAAIPAPKAPPPPAQKK
jgi:hypothetical protein